MHPGLICTKGKSECHSTNITHYNYVTGNEKNPFIRFSLNNPTSVFYLFCSLQSQARVKVVHHERTHQGEAKLRGGGGGWRRITSYLEVCFMGWPVIK